MVRVIRKVFFVLIALTGATNAVASTRVSFDNSQTSVRFACTAGLVGVSGHFSEVKGVVDFDEMALHRSEVRATIRSDSLTTGQDLFDRQLKGRSFFDASAHPTIVFKSSAVGGTNVRQTQISGSLTLRGVTRAIALQVTLQPPELSARHIDAGKPKLTNASRIFRATTQIRRSEFGMTGYDLLVGDQCEIQIMVAVSL